MLRSLLRINLAKTLSRVPLRSTCELMHESIIERRQLSSDQAEAVSRFPWSTPALLAQYLPKSDKEPGEDVLWTDFAKRTHVVPQNKNINAYMRTFLQNRGCIDDFNILYREFHQWCAIPDFEGLDDLCEKGLATRLKEAVKGIHVSGLALDMERLIVTQPEMQIISFEVFRGLHVDRALNGKKSAYEEHKDAVLGIWPACTVYKKKTDSLYDSLDAIEANYTPYMLRVKMLIQSHMKLFVYAKNKDSWIPASSKLGGGYVSNVVQFECNLRGTDFFRLMPIDMKPPMLRHWKMTDFNNVMHGNPLFLRE